MVLKQKQFIFLLSFVISSLVFAQSINAATLFLVSDKKTVKIGEEINIDVRIDTEGESINAAQGVINFPVNLFKAIKTEKTNSVFGFWIDDPVFSNEDGTANFIGGASKGVTGKSLQILKLTLKAQGVGSADFSLSDAVVTASDGKGTNILSHVGGTVVNVGTEVVISTETTTEETPEKVERPPVLAVGLPVTPAIRVPFYPDQSQWNNYIGETIALWDVPLDVTQISAEINQNPNAMPTTPEKVLFTGKNFGNLKEGIWYVHVRFKNNIGWGKTAHYKISLDTTVPLPFEAKINNQTSDDPSPQVTFTTQDSLSGVSYAALFVDNREALRVTTTTIASVLPPQSPGMHTLLVRVFDLAGNSIEDDLQFEILPLPTPTIEFISKSVSQGEIIFASGKSIPNASVGMRMLNAEKQEVFTGNAQSDNSGNWKMSIDKVLPLGEYTLTVMVQDERGALSYPTQEESIKIRPRVVLSLGGVIDLGWFEISIIVVLAALLGSGLIARRYVDMNRTRGAYKTIIGRDIDKLSVLLYDNLKGLEDSQGLDEPSRIAQVSALIDEMRRTIAKIKKYVGEEVNKLK